MTSLCRVIAVVAALLLIPAVGSADPDSILSFDGATGWLNSKPLTLADVQGKVVLVDFWEYTCVNCLRTLPYLREWYKRYAGDGFVIVGVHTPEFTFSGDSKNVEAATKRLGVTWPVALDSNDAIWNRYGNNSWPHELLFAQNGHRVESVIGEGGYPETEAKIQALLKLMHPNLQLPPVMALLPQDSYDKPGAVCYPETAETYLGGQRSQIANLPPQLARDPFNPQPQFLMAQALYSDNVSDHKDGKVYLQGGWRKTSQAVVSIDDRGHVAMKYHAIQVVSVMRPEGGSPVNVLVTQDGKPIPKEDAGADIHYDAQGRSYVDVDQPREYDLIMNKKFGTHQIALFPQARDLGVYTFDFESCEVPNDK
jgi:thiol-disulfide isomerase/thioredoxin